MSRTGEAMSGTRPGRTPRGPGKAKGGEGNRRGANASGAMARGGVTRAGGRTEVPVARARQAEAAAGFVRLLPPGRQTAFVAAPEAGLTCPVFPRAVRRVGRCARSRLAELRDVRSVADLLASRALGPGLPESTLAGQVGSPGLAPLTHRAPTDARERHWYYPLPADTMRSW